MSSRMRDPHVGKPYILVEKTIAMASFATTPFTALTSTAVGDLILDEIQILRDGGTCTTATNVGVKVATSDGYAPKDGSLEGIVFSEAIANFGANKCFRTGSPTTAAGGWGGGSVVSCGKIKVPHGAVVQAYATGATAAGTGNAKIIMKFVRLKNNGFIKAA